MNTLIFDTETTGKATFALPPTHPSQPRLVQLGAILYDSDWTPRAEMNFIIQSFGFDIPVEATKCHGISKKETQAYGLSEQLVLEVFEDFCNFADCIVSYNIQYDLLVIEHAYFVWQRSRQRLDPLLNKSFCAMRAMTDICKLPGKYGSYKYPSLTEAHIHCFGKPFDNAHDAMADVRACAAVYRWLKTPKNNEPTNLPNSPIHTS